MENSGEASTPPDPSAYGLSRSGARLAVDGAEHSLSDFSPW